MPCQSWDNPVLDRFEAEQLRTCSLLVYVLEHTDNQQIQKWMRDGMYQYDRTAPDPTPLLCDAIKKMSPTRRERIVYNGRSATARDLADWWEQHQAEDREREAAEDTARTKALRIASAKLKLAPEEWEAVTRDC